MSQEQMSQEDFAIVKLAAAQRYKERNIHPETAHYLFERKLSKLAQVPGPQAGPTKARAFFEANRGRSPLQTAVNVDGAQPAGGAMSGVRRAVSGVTRGIGNAIGPSKHVRNLIAKGVGGAKGMLSGGTGHGVPAPEPKPAGGAMPAVRRAVGGVGRGIGDAIGPPKPVGGIMRAARSGAMAKADPSVFEKQQSAKEAAAPDKITKLAGALKNVLPPKQADAKAAKATKLSEGLKKLVNG